MNDMVLNKLIQLNRVVIDRLSIKEIKRKMFHLSSLWIPLLIYFMHTIDAIFLFSYILILNLIFEYANYKQCKWSQGSFGIIFCSIMRPFEKDTSKFTLSGGFYVLCATVLSLLFFTKEIACVSIAVMLIADANAALYGKMFGKHTIYQNKTAEGSLAFFISSVIVVCICHLLVPVTTISIFACLIVTLVEIYGKVLKIDDNLSIPLIFGLILTFL